MDRDALLRHADFIRNLASSLVADEQQAEDAAQEAMLVALARSPENPGAARAWLGSVVRNYLRNASRSRQRCREREQSVAVPEARPDDTWLKERERTLAGVVEAVTSLKCAQRTVILLRYYEGLPPRRIAERLGVPVETVRTRLKRALSELRRRLDRSHGGDRAAWSLVLAPFAATSEGTLAASGPFVALATGLLAMSTTLKLILLAMVAAAAVIPWLAVNDAGLATGSSPTPAPLAGETDSVTRGPSDSRAVPAGPVERTEVRGEATRPAASLDEPGAQPSDRRAGQVLDARGRPLAGVRLSIEQPERLTVVSDARGRFVLPVEHSPATPVVAPPFVAVRSGLTASGSDLLLVVARGITVSGTISDPFGTPLPGALVEVWPVPMVEFPEIIDRTARIDLSARRVEAAAGGRFELGEVPAQCAALRVAKLGYETLIVPVSEELAGDQRFTLQPLATGVHVLCGTVLDHVSWGVPDAFVAFGGTNRARTDRTGFFRLEYVAEEIPGTGADLVVARPGFRTKVTPGLGARPNELPRQAYVEVRLDGPALEISGRLVHANGTPHEGAMILPWQEEFVCADSTAVDLAVAGEVLPLASGRAVATPCRTDARGGFTLGGLSDRAYRLRVFDQSQGLTLTSLPIRAGTRGAVLTIPGGALREQLTGRVVGLAGEPLAGVRVIVSMLLVDNSRTHAWRTMNSTFTGADGRFEFRNVCRLDTCRVRALGEGVLDAAAYIEPDDPGTEILLVVEERCHFRVQLDDDTTVTGFRLLNQEGEPLPIHHFGAIEGDQWTQTFPLQKGRSPVLCTSPRACLIQLLGENERLLPIRLKAGEVTVLRP